MASLERALWEVTGKADYQKAAGSLGARVEAKAGFTKAAQAIDAVCNRG